MEEAAEIKATILSIELHLLMLLLPCYYVGSEIMYGGLCSYLPSSSRIPCSGSKTSYEVQTTGCKLAVSVVPLCTLLFCTTSRHQDVLPDLLNNWKSG